MESLADRRGKPDICEEEASYDRTRKTLHHIECKENFEVIDNSSQIRSCLYI